MQAHQHTGRLYRRMIIILCTLLGAGLFWPAISLAHPLGNFSLNRYSRLELESGQIHLYYILDIAEIPSFQLWDRLDRDKDGQINSAEEAAYLAWQIPELESQLYLAINSTPTSLILEDQRLTFPPGQGGLPTTRLELDFSASPQGEGDLQHLIYEDRNFPDRLGWQEIIFQAQDEIQVLDSSVATDDISQALTQYPNDLLKNPLQINQAEIIFRLNPPGAAQKDAETNLSRPNSEKMTDPFSDLITLPDFGLKSVALALLLAFIWGAAHALSPGHGKTIVAAFLVGARGTVQHALFLGLTTTITHTLGVFILGIITLFASRFFLPEQLYPWLSLASGLLVVGIGVSMLRNRLTGGKPHHHHHHSHEDDHDHHHHDGHDDHHTQSHLPLNAQGQITWRSLLALGVSGGLIPCPSALVVMLSAIALHRVGFGLLLILIFSLGLASVLTSIGILWVTTRQWLEQKTENALGVSIWLKRSQTLLPALSALFITLVGMGITIQAFSRINFLY